MATAGAVLTGSYNEAQNVSYNAGDKNNYGNILQFILPKAVLNAAGGLEQIITSTGGAGEGRGTQKNVEVYANGGVIIGRWTDGTGSAVHSSIPALDGTINDNVLSANQGVNYAITLPVPIMPVMGGRADYTLAAATKPTYFHDGTIAPGTFSDGKLSVLFGSQPKLAFQGTVTFAGPTEAQVYKLTTLGGIANPAGNTIFTRLNGDGSFSSPIQVSSTGAGSLCLNTGCTDGSDNKIVGGLSADLTGAALVYSINRQIFGSVAFYLSGATNLSTSVPAGTTSGASAGSGLSTGIHSVLLGGSYSANGSGQIVIQSRGTTTFDASGALLAVDSIAKRTTATVADQAAGQGWEIGRWNGGAVETNGLGTGLFLPTQGVHYVVMDKPTGALSLGLLNYTLGGATTPTYSNGRLITSSSFTGHLSIAISNLDAVNFGNKYGFDATITATDALGTNVYSVISRGGIANPSVPLTTVNGGLFSDGSLGSVGSRVTVIGHDCQSSSYCAASFALQSGGVSAGLVGVSYSIIDISGFHSDRALYPILSGAALFTETGSASLPTYPVAAAGTERTAQTLSMVLGMPNSAIGLTPASAYGTYKVKSTDAGAITAFNDGQYLDIVQGTTTAAEAGVSIVAGSGRISWSRWTNGSSYNNYNTGDVYDTISPNQGRHIVAGDPASAIPTVGTAVYDLAGATAPTVSDGSQSPGTLTGTMGVSFATRKVGFDLLATVGGYGYVMKTTGGSVDASTSTISYDDNNFQPNPSGRFGGTIAVPVGGAACPTGGGACSAAINGFLSGIGAKQAGITYTIQRASNNPIDQNQSITGAAAFIKR
jgi:hypothetical protein